jgi:small-conductance mechanosensitive channel
MALGLDMTKITIIFGALSVGIGFGLQTIVNNFISGIIMLFERPVKVGDYIELNGQWAEIKKIGLRSTVVETFDRSEIVADLYAARTSSNRGAAMFNEDPFG